MNYIKLALNNAYWDIKINDIEFLKMHLKHDNMHNNCINYAFKCNNNDAPSCINCMLSHPYMRPIKHYINLHFHLVVFESINPEKIYNVNILHMQ